MLSDRDRLLTAQVMLLPHDWRDGRGEVTACAMLTGADGVTRPLWADGLRAGDRGRPSGHRLRCLVPAGSHRLILSVRRLGEPKARSVARAICADPHLRERERHESPPPIRAPGTQAADGVSQSVPGPVISVLTPVHNPPLEMLQEAIASVTSQTYPHWELCLIDDGSTDPAVISALATPRRHTPPASTSPATTPPRASPPPPTTPSNSPPATTSRCWTTTTPSPPTPCRPSPSTSTQTPPWTCSTPTRTSSSTAGAYGCTSNRAGPRTRCGPTATRATWVSTGGRWCRRSAGFAPSSTAHRTST